MNVIITEKQNVASKRTGTLVEAKSLAAAKRAASQAQMFQGTVLTIENEQGRLLAVKENGVWTNYDA